MRSASISASCGSRATDSRNSGSALMNAARTEESSSTISRCFTSLSDESGAATHARGHVVSVGEPLGGPIELDPLVSPVRDRLDRRAERAPLFRQRVFHPNRRLGNDRPLDDPFLFELLEALAEHAVGDIGNGVAQRREAAARPEQDEDDGAGPPAADELAGTVKAGAERRRVSRMSHISNAIIAVLLVTCK